MDESSRSESGVLNSKKMLIGLAVAVVVLVLVIGGLLLLSNNQSQNQTTNGNQSSSTSSTSDNMTAIAAGQSLSNGKCTGEGSAQLTVSPMKAEDFAYYQPYGLMVGAHVTPIDHGYFSPADSHSARDTYEVRVMADAKVVDISHRGEFIGNSGSGNGQTDEYRIVFSHSCTFFTYYDLVTSLSPTLKTAFDAHNFDVDVKAGDVIGYIGGQTLDFAVWDTTKSLTGFANPASYTSENWKIYTANPFDYMATDVKELILSKDLRQVEPRQGKIDYDVAGKLIGNWFLKDTNGYQGLDQSKYWVGHLSFSPNYIDPTVFVISIGEYKGNAVQFGALDNKPDPSTVGVDTGLVKYDLVQQIFTHKDGSMWDMNKFANDLVLKNQTTSTGCLLAQLQDADNLRVEIFAGKKCSAVSGFDVGAKDYQR